MAFQVFLYIKANNAFILTKFIKHAIINKLTSENISWQ